MSLRCSRDWAMYLNLIARVSGHSTTADFLREAVMQRVLASNIDRRLLKDFLREDELCRQLRTPISQIPAGHGAKAKAPSEGAPAASGNDLQMIADPQQQQQEQLALLQEAVTHG